MSEINLTAKLAIQNGKLEEFKSIALKCIAAVAENEKGKTCLRYDWFFNNDSTICHVKETYTNSASFMIHMGNVGELLGQLLQVSTLSGEIYGDLSEEVQNAISGLDVTHFAFFKGA